MHACSKESVKYVKTSRTSKAKSTIDECHSKSEGTHIAQPKPLRSMTRCTMMGNITPPRLEPETMIPNARALFFENHVPTLLMAAKKIKLAPMGLQTPVADEQAISVRGRGCWGRTLGEEVLIVLGANGGHEKAKDVQETPDQ